MTAPRYASELDLAPETLCEEATGKVVTLNGEKTTVCLDQAANPERGD
jgi:hypothetical protein